jgi:hypothetical protein
MGVAADIDSAAARRGRTVVSGGRLRCGRFRAELTSHIERITRYLLANVSSIAAGQHDNELGA